MKGSKLQSIIVEIETKYKDVYEEMKNFADSIPNEALWPIDTITNYRYEFTKHINEIYNREMSKQDSSLSEILSIDKEIRKLKYNLEKELLELENKYISKL